MASLSQTYAAGNIFAFSLWWQGFQVGHSWWPSLKLERGRPVAPVTPCPVVLALRFFWASMKGVNALGRSVQ